MNASIGVVFTPPKIVELILDGLPIEVWKDMRTRFLDPCAGYGQFAVAIFNRLMIGLKDSIPSDSKRQLHILSKMLYMVELDAKFAKKCKNCLDPDNEFQLNLFVGDSLKMEEWKFFDVIVGNPPYNLGAQPLYHTFISHFWDKSRYLSFIVPSRWFSGGKGLDGFRKEMLAKKDIKFIRHEKDSKLVFPDVNISGGVCFFLKDSEYSGLCKFNGSKIDLNKYDIVVHKRYHDIVDRLMEESKLVELYAGRCYGIETNDKRLLDKSCKGAIKCYVSAKKGGEKWIKMEPDGFWKVVTARANTEGFGRMFIGAPDEVHSGSFISFKVKSLEEAESLLSYLKCDLPGRMLKIRRNCHNLSEKVLEWIPLPPLYRIWTNEKIDKYYKLA